MRVCARLSAVQRLKQKEAAAAAAEEQQNGERQENEPRKRGRRRRLVPLNPNLWQSSVSTRATTRTMKPIGIEWQEQQSGAVRASDFNWEQYLTVRNGTAAVNGHLFQHQDFMERTLAQHIFRPGSSVRVHCFQNGENRQWVSARISITLPFGQALVEMPTRAEAEQPVRNGRIFGMDNGGVRIESVQLDMVEMAENAYDGDRATGEGTVENDFRTILRERRELLGRHLHTFLQEGQLFELQEAPSSQSDSSQQNVPSYSSSASSTANNFLRVHTVRIVGHRHGLVLVKRIGEDDEEGGRPELVHITSERCHPLGWTRTQHPSDKYSLDDTDELGDRTSSSAVPRWLFSFRPLATHKFEVGMLLEMLDPLSRLSFVPAYVTERVNSHYFRIRPVRDVQSLEALLQHTSDYIMHCKSPDIFPLGWCFKNQIRLTFPQGMNHTDTSFSYAALRLKLHDLFVAQPYNHNNGNGNAFVADASPTLGVQAVQHEQSPSSSILPFTSSCFGDDPSCSQSTSLHAAISLPTEFTFAPDSLFDLPKMAQKRLECVRYCEVQDTNDSELFYPGAIVRSHQHLIWVHVDRDESIHRPAQIYTINSPQLFRCGTAKTTSIAMSSSATAAAAASLRYFTVPIRFPSTMKANHSRVLGRTFTSQRTPMFLTRPKQFLSEMWMKADLLLPPIFLNANCFCGPFLVADRVCALPVRYASSPLPHAISTLIKNLFTCGNGGFGTRVVRELIDLVGADRTSQAPLQMMIKLKYANRRVRFSVETCERAAQFPGWLRMLLIRLDACPNLFSLEKQEKCPLNCLAGFASSNYLIHSGHVNTASLQSSQQQTTKLNQAAQQLRKVVQQQQKKRKNGRNKKIKKLEEEETEYALRQSQPFPARREPSKRLSIAQPVIDYYYDQYDDVDEEEGEEAEEDDDGIGNGGKAMKRKRSRHRRDDDRKEEEEEEDSPVADDYNDVIHRKSISTTTSNSSSSVNSSQQQTEQVGDEPEMKAQQRRSRSSSSSSSSHSTADEQQSSLSTSSSSSPITPATWSIPTPTAAPPPQTPPLAPQQRQPMVQQQEVKREQQANSEDEVQWCDPQQAPQRIRNESNQQHQHANTSPPAQNPDMNMIHGVAQQQHHQHYPTPMPIYTPYLYAAAAPPHQYAPYAYFYAPVAAPSATSSCPPSSSAAPPFLHHPPHVHLMPAPPPPPPPTMFGTMASNVVGTSASSTAASTSNCISNTSGISSPGTFDCPPVTSNPARWSAEVLCQWLTAAGLADCAQRLLNEEVDGASLLLFSPVHFQNLGLKLGPMVKLQKIVEYLRRFSAGGAKQ